VEEAWELAAVSTSASRLHSFLKEVVGQSPIKQNRSTLVSRITFTLGLDRSDDGEAFIVLRDMVRELMSDVTNGLEPDQVSHVMTLCAPIQPLLSMPTMGQPVSNGQNQYLSPTAFSNLKTLDLILSARVTRKEPDFGGYQSAITELQEAVEALKLDPILTTAINKRIVQVEFALRNYLSVGPSTTVESIQSLMGSIELLVPSRKKKGIKGKAALASLTTLVGGIIFALSKAENATDSIVGLIENHTKIVGFLEHREDASLEIRQTDVDSGSEEE